MSCTMYHALCSWVGLVKGEIDDQVSDDFSSIEQTAAYSSGFIMMKLIAGIIVIMSHSSFSL